jgi:hypothetical protein
MNDDTHSKSNGSISPDDVKGFVPQEYQNSYVDEVAGWCIAAFGLYIQVSHHLIEPLPFETILLPLPYWQGGLVFEIILLPLPSEIISYLFWLNLLAILSCISCMIPSH